MADSEFWIKSELDNLNFLLPVTPSKYEIEYANNVEVVNAIIGDVNIPTSYKLSNVMLEGFFTVKNYPYVNKKTYNANTCMDYVELIKMLVAYKRIIRLIVAKDNETKINLPFIVEYINYYEEDGSGDIYYKISLKEYRSISLGNETQRVANNVAKTARIHVVTETDTLKNIARKYYGNAELWTKIYEANKDKIKIPEKIYLNQEFIIP